MPTEGKRINILQEHESGETNSPLISQQPKLYCLKAGIGFSNKNDIE